MCSYAKLFEESKLFICEPSILNNNWPSNGDLSSEREISIQKTSCHDVVVYQFQRERMSKLPRSRVPVPIWERTCKLRNTTNCVSKRTASCVSVSN